MRGGGGESKEREGGEEGGGRRGEILILYKNTLELLVSGVLECIGVETAMCTPLYTTVLHYLTGNKASRLDPIS